MIKSLETQMGCKVVNKSKRIPLLDYVRVITAFLVIYGHLYPYDPENYVRVFIYQFHMPLFFVVSGMLHKYDGTIQVRKYIRTILIPVVFYATVFFAITGILYHCGYGDYKESILAEIWGGNLLQTYANYLKYSIIGICKGFMILDGPCWFLIALFYCKLFMDFALQKKKNALFLWVLFFLVLCVHIHKYLFAANAIMAMPFYVFGYVGKNKLLAIAKMKYPISLSILTILIVLFIMYVNGSVSMWGISFGNFGKLSIPVFYIQGVVGTLMLFSLCAIFKKPNPMVTKWANSLISILGLQVLFIFLSDNFLGVEWNYFEALGVSVVIMFLCIGCHGIIVRYCPILIGKTKK